MFDSFASVSERAWGLIEAGGFVMPPLLAASLTLGWGLAVRASVLLPGSRRSLADLVERAADKPSAGRPQVGFGVLAQAANIGVEVCENSGVADLRPHLEEAFFELRRGLEVYSVLVRTLVMIVPLGGLLGTVAGMTETFDALGDMALFAQSGGVAGGISQALLTTQLGLTIAIPGMLVSRLLARRQRTLDLQLTQLSDLLYERYRGAEEVR